MTEICRICRRPKATEEGHEAELGGHVCEKLCWRDWNQDAECWDTQAALESAAVEMRDALEWAQSELGKTTRPNPVDKALAAAKGGTP